MIFLAKIVRSFWVGFQINVYYLGMIVQLNFREIHLFALFVHPPC